MKFYERKWFAVVMFFLFFPIGMFLIYKYRHFGKHTNKILAVLLVLLVISAIANVDSEKKNNTQEQEELPKETHQKKHTEDELLIGEIVGDLKRIDEDIVEYTINKDTGVIIINIDTKIALTDNLTRMGVGYDMFKITQNFSKIKEKDIFHTLILSYHTTLVDLKGNEEYSPIFKEKFTQDDLKDVVWDNVINEQNVFKYGTIMFKHPSF